MHGGTATLALAVLLAAGSAQARESAAAPLPAEQSQPATAPATMTVAERPGSTPDIATPRHHARGDPWEGFNRWMFRRQQGFDRAVFRPLARGYGTIVPKPVRTGLRHLLSHITEPIVFLNDLLQLKPKRAVRTLARFLINTTAGIGGLLDVAKTAKLPHRDNGLGNTLARYGVGPGPYLFLPFVGPTGLRDLFGAQVDGVLYPVVIGRPFDRLDYQLSTTVIGGLDLRNESDAGFKALLDGAADPYATLRSVYQQNRAAEVAELTGKTVEPAGLDDPLLDPEAAPTDQPAAGDPEPGAAPAPASAPAPVPAEPSPPSGATVDAASGVPQLVSFL
ncbi:VacJ family lipoprotein [Sphingomonas sp. 28-63-12]|uniref:MlaA family lipoprotein n=1 Tax=Sphingomonas sp. 28-63-12 TaxID=1970434 RepID=UPI0035A95CFB